MKNKSAWTRILFPVALAAVLLFAFAACGDGAGAHTHSPGAAASCTTTQTCTVCGDVLAPALGHLTLNWATLIPATGHVTCSRAGCTGGLAETGATGPGGGIIFYAEAAGFTMTDTGTPAHYLEAGSTLWPAGLHWASAGFESTDITGTERDIGTGRENTALILATDTNADAARTCKNYGGGGKDDWFLPSLEEASLFREFLPGGPLFWSSTQSDYDCGRAYASNHGSSAKDSIYMSTRAIRAF